jgi:adenosylcobinamide kinase/adenosylcobinamide-phosphate guanylyltransferase
MPRIDLTLITGGIRSGKSELAERLASELGDRIAYVATGVATDPEMQVRIDEHRQRRPESWVTVEAPRGHVASVLQPHLKVVRGVLLDDLGGLASQHVLRTASVSDADAGMREEEQAILSVVGAAGLPTIVVTSEVGLALVPPTDLGRRFADVLGRANQRWANVASNVTMVIAGLPVRLK